VGTRSAAGDRAGRRRGPRPGGSRQLNYGQSGILGVVEGLTEFLPVSSTAHLTVAEKLLDLKIDAPDVTAFTAVVQFGAIIAVLIYFRHDLIRLIGAGLRALRSPAARQDPDAKLCGYLIVGSIPIGIVGLVFKDAIEGPLRNLVVIAVALIAWSAVMWYAERHAAGVRGERQLTFRDVVILGLWQCIALIPGISRSGATISGGLLRGINRVEATRLSFLLAIPALTGATLLELPKAMKDSNDVGPTIFGIVIAFVVAYASVAWLLRFVAGHKITAFVPYRIAAGIVLLVLLATSLV
jgi:undecaprenyl-diphosphatase